MKRTPGAVEKAARLIAGNEPEMLETVSRVLGGLIIVAPVATNVSALTLFGLLQPKDELIAGLHSLKRAALRRASGSAGSVRVDLLLAAHTVLILESFFEATAHELGDFYDALEVTSREKRLLASVESGTAERFSEDYATYRLPAAGPVPEPPQTFDEHLHALEKYYKQLAKNFERFASGLRAWEDADEEKHARVQARLRFHITRTAVSHYISAYIGLCAESTEFYIWTRLQEDFANRSAITSTITDAVLNRLQQLTAASHGHKAGLKSLHELLSQIPIGESRGDEMVHALRRSYTAWIDRPLSEATNLGLTDGPDIAVPTIRDGYVTPRYRAVQYATGCRIADESWWSEETVESDFERFIAGVLTAPSSYMRPVLILGDPGAGKSLLCKVIGACFDNAALFPVIVTLRDVSADAGVLTQIEQQLATTTALSDTRWRDLRRKLDVTTPVVFLDGFDELLLATGTTKSAYLEQVQRFQETELSVHEAPVVVVVTSRTQVAERARVPAGSPVVRLEPFTTPQIEEWVAQWNSDNSDYFERRNLEPLSMDALAPWHELAAQPLLLILLAIYDADGNPLGNERGTPRASTLYDRMIKSFVRRELLKTSYDLPHDALPMLIKNELDLLSTVALSMYNRRAQRASLNDLDADVRSLELEESLPAPSPTGVGLPLTLASRIIARFFFVHHSEASIGANDVRVGTYEFLHATFGEFLVARMAVEQASDIARDLQAARTTASLRRRPVSDELMRSLFSFEPFTSRSKVISFLHEYWEDHGAPVGLADAVGTLIADIISGRSDVSREAYQPRALNSAERMSIYTANLFTIFLTSQEGRDPVRLTGLGFVSSGDWTRLTRLWWAHVRGESWDGLVRMTQLDTADKFDDWTVRLAANADGRSMTPIEGYKQDTVMLLDERFATLVELSASIHDASNYIGVLAFSDDPQRRSHAHAVIKILVADPTSARKPSDYIMAMEAAYAYKVQEFKAPFFFSTLLRQLEVDAFTCLTGGDTLDIVSAMRKLLDVHGDVDDCMGVLQCVRAGLSALTRESEGSRDLVAVSVSSEETATGGDDFDEFVDYRQGISAVVNAALESAELGTLAESDPWTVIELLTDLTKREARSSNIALDPSVVETITYRVDVRGLVDGGSLYRLLDLLEAGIEKEADWGRPIYLYKLLAEMLSDVVDHLDRSDIERASIILSAYGGPTAARRLESYMDRRFEAP